MSLLVDEVSKRGQRYSLLLGWASTLPWRTPTTMRCGCFRHWKHTERLRMRENRRLFIEMSLMAEMQRRSLFVMSARNCATLVWMTTQSPHRLRKLTIIRLAISQTKTSSLLTPNVSFALKYGTSQVSLVKKPTGSTTPFSLSNMKCVVYIRKESYANAVL